MNRAVFQGPLGPITLSETAGRIVSVDWLADPGEGSDLLTEAVRQLAAYFERRLTAFDLPLEFGTGFQAQVGRAIAAISYGWTRSYGDLARELGVPAQAIGQACGANLIPILIPCHRVLGATGLGGFSAKGGVETKVALLKLEGAASLLL